MFGRWVWTGDLAEDGVELVEELGDEMLLLFVVFVVVLLVDFRCSFGEIIDSSWSWFCDFEWFELKFFDFEIAFRALWTFGALEKKED